MGRPARPSHMGALPAFLPFLSPVVQAIASYRSFQNLGCCLQLIVSAPAVPSAWNALSFIGRWECFLNCQGLVWAAPSQKASPELWGVSGASPGESVLLSLLVGLPSRGRDQVPCPSGPPVHGTGWEVLPNCRLLRGGCLMVSPCNGDPTRRTLPLPQTLSPGSLSRRGPCPEK